ncbi:carbohydrate kinase family protein [Myxococcota bacterium]|nr:carbohydrate kinase family protein [Myxococcota bacterium]
MAVLVSGSIALDHLMAFPDRFANHILPDKLDTLNVAFNIESLVTHFGGVAGNISYLLGQLGEDGRILATVGSDFGAYAEWLDRNEISRDGIRVLDDVRTAQGFATTDLDGNQIWAFYEGAMARAHEARVEDVDGPIEMAIVSSNGKRAMVEHARILKQRQIPTWIDPSHGLPLLSREELIELIEGSAAYVVNDYEWAKTLEQTELSEDEIASRCEVVIITRGEAGSELRMASGNLSIPPATAERVVDPTGCGDAYRAGMMHARLQGLSWEVAGRIGSVMGALQVAVEGPQTLVTDTDALREHYSRAFGEGF